MLVIFFIYAVFINGGINVVERETENITPSGKIQKQITRT